MKLILRELQPQDEKAFLTGLKAWGEESSWHSFVWKEGMHFQEMLQILDDRKNGRNLPEGLVPDTMLYGFIDEDTIVGRVSVRHVLNDYLAKRGGHLGYGVAPSFRKRGYASQMMEQSLGYCRSLGLKKLLITCASTNIASSKIIEKFGGILEQEVWDDEDKEMIKRYWISL
ncbi:MAG: GNAT family N-acetyltransferase [Halobacteriovoraceae bacterium]|nr:GNAT family N-acetyltransferase [Halobacteriovoraceae bacterium]|tara:strand:+ start:2748 stop:3263 length:516 start_codon:yes stop_codon:yes gene_type:complete